MIVFTNHCGRCNRYIGTKHNYMCGYGSDNKVVRSQCNYETKPKIKRGVV